jgi:hypothetical protein
MIWKHAVGFAFVLWENIDSLSIDEGKSGKDHMTYI